MNILIGWLLIGVAIALFLIGLVAALGRRSDAQPRPATRCMLVLLRLAIGWHFLIEGVEKLHNPAWTSAGYLREATGPLAPQFRELAGNSLADMLTLQEDKTLSPVLDQAWQNYLDAVVRFYNLDEAQTARLTTALDAVKEQTARKLQMEKEVEIPAPYPPTLKEKLTIPQRLTILNKLQDKVAELETGWLPQYTSDIFEAWKTAKGNVNRWRGDLQKDLDLVNRNMKRAVRQALLNLLADKMPADKRAKVEAAVKRLMLQADTERNGAHAKIYPRLKLARGHTYVIDMESRTLDCYLRLEDGSGIVLAEDLGTGRKARITYKVPEARAPLPKEPDPKIDIPDSYRIVAGSFGKEIGSFTLLCMDQADKKPTETKEDQKPGKKSFAIGTPWADKLEASDKDPLRKPADLSDWESIDKIKERLDTKIADEFRKTVDPVTDDPLTLRVLDNILAKRKKDQPNDPLPFAVGRPIRQWTLLDWSDHIVKYGILSVGALLLVGLFTRLACLAGAGFLLTFFLAMPPLPGLPDGPRSEGHYLYVNKNIIEMLALLVLATTWSGRWLGLDGLVQFLNPWRWRSPANPGNMKS